MNFESSWVLVWCLLIPPACLAIDVAIRRTARSTLVFSFSLGTVCISLAETFYDIYIGKNYDSKFREAPTVALELGLLGDLVICFPALVLFAVTLAVASKKNLPRGIGYYLPGVLGALYTTLPRQTWFGQAETSSRLFWTWILAAPVASALLTMLAGSRKGAEA
jgi:hypothetical protein